MLQRVTHADREAVLAMNRTSRALHHPWMAPPVTRTDFERWAARWAAPDYLPLAIRRRDGGELVGIVNVSQIFLGPLRSAFLGYYGSAAHAGQGLMTEGLELAVRHCFGALGLHRVEASIQPGNGPSRRLVQRLGFTREGTSRRYLKIGGRWRDHERWALLKEDLRRAPPRAGLPRSSAPG